MSVLATECDATKQCNVMSDLLVSLVPPDGSNTITHAVYTKMTRPGPRL